MNLAFSYTLTFNSEWHLGSGRERPGDVDRLIKRRNSTGQPYVSAKTLTGVLRWEIENFSELLGLHINSGIVRLLFGDTPIEDAASRRYKTAPRTKRSPSRLRPASLSLRSAHLASWMTEVMTEQGLDQFATMVVAQTAMQESGVSLVGSLRRTEVVRRGTSLHGTGQIDMALFPNEVACSQAIAMLIVGAERLQRLGGKRNRGLGECKLQLQFLPELETQLTSDPLGWALDQLSGGASPTLDVGFLTHAPRSETPATLASMETDNELQSLEIEIEALDRLIIEDVVVGNVTRTLGFIPGARLLPIIAGLLRAEGIDPNPLIDAGRLQIRNATPVVAGKRGVPVPLSLYEPKRTYRYQGQNYGGAAEGGLGVINLAAAEAFPTEHQYRQLRQGWLANDRSPSVMTYRGPLTTEIETMNTIDDSRGRTSSDVGGLYSYETLAEGEQFRSVVVAPQTICAMLTRLLGGAGVIDRVGTSKKDDFGRIMLRAEASGLSAPLPVSTSNDAANTTETVERFSVWCVSPVLVRDSFGVPITSMGALASALSSLLGVSISISGDALQPQQWSRPFRSETWKAKWGLPNPSLVGIAEGSIGIFQSAEAIAVTKLQQLELVGLGLRRAAGFGEICIEHRSATQKRLGQKISLHTNVNVAEKSPAHVGEDAFLSALGLASWRRRVQRFASTVKLTELLPELTPEDWKGISASQLGNYREAVAQMFEPEEDVWLPIKLRSNIGLSRAFGALPARVLSVHELIPPGSDDDHSLWREAVQIIVSSAVTNTTRGSRAAPAIGTLPASNNDNLVTDNDQTIGAIA